MMEAWFTTPWFLLGALTALIPVVLHLIYRKRAPRVPFPTVRFLIIAVKRTSHRRRIQELLLLLLRAAALGLLAVGLAGPFLRSGGLFGKGDTTLALILDNSYSMATESEGVARYARAKDLARDVIRELSPSSKVVLLFTNRRAHVQEAALEGAATTDHERLVAEIESSEVSAADGDVGSALARALEALDKQPNPNREIYIVTDMQKDAWKNLPKLQPGAAAYPIVVLDCSTTGYRNLAVTNAAIRSKGRATNVPITIEAQILNATDRPESGVGVSLYIDNVRTRQRTTDVGPRAATLVSFQETFKTPGTRTGWVQIDAEDSLPYDNKRFFAVEVAERIPVLLVQDEEGAIPLLDDLFYLLPALDPAEAGSVEVRSVIQPTRLLRAALAKTNPSRYAAVFLVNCAEFTPEETRVLTEYVDRGGAVVFFPGERTSPEAWNRLVAAAGQPGQPPPTGLLPAKLGKSLGKAGEHENPLRLANLDVEHPMMTPFRGLPKAVFDSVNIYRCFEIEVPQGSPAQVLAWLDNGKPLLAYRPTGRGHAFVWATAAGTAWSNFPIRVLFLPMMHQLVYHVVGAREEESSLLAGAPKLFAPDERGETPVIEVTDPMGQRLRVGVAPAAGQPAGQAAGPARFVQTFARGVYAWRTAHGPLKEGAFVVNANGRESDLEALDAKAVQALFGERPVHFGRSGQEIRQLAVRLRKGVQLWNLVIFVVVGVAVAECFLANRRDASDAGAARRLADAA